MASEDASASPAARVQIEAIQTVVSMRPTDPPLARKVVLKQVVEKVFRKCHHVLLYYKKANDEDSGWVMVGRLKESLGRALCQYPMFTGRVRWVGADEGRDGSELVIVSNDSGMRLVEAKYPMHMDEFLRLEDQEAAESELVYWDDLKEQDPQFCPLAYIQVTDFECGGYSIGLSLSALVGDASELSGFLEHLAATHLDIFFKQNKLPAFYLPKHKSTKLYPVPNNLARRRHAGQTLLYRIHNPELSTTELKGLASLSIKDAERKLGVDLGPDFELTLYTKDGSTGDLTVEKCKGLTWVALNALPKLNGAKWDDKIFDQVTFWEGHKPVRGAYWIGLGVEEGLVMVNTSRLDDSIIHITVSVPGTSFITQDTVV